MTYKFLGQVNEGGAVLNQYQITLSIYEDCLYGNPEAIAQDNPAYFAIYDGNGNFILGDSLVFYDELSSVPDNFNSNCITDAPPVCINKKTFQKAYALAPNASGYVVAYQRCCRSGMIVNIQDPTATGSTYYCRIPSKTIGTNNSAVFKNYPPLVICANNPLIYDNSATDADGDSLSYGFCDSYDGADQTNVKPLASPPPYQGVTYLYPYTFRYPIASSPVLAIDPVSGLITGTPNADGRFLISVACIEWRHGVPIDTIRREFQFTVTNCSKKVVASMPQFSDQFNTYIVDCSNFNVFFENNSIVGTPDSTFLWIFGVPGAVSDTSNLYEPSFTYPDTGIFVVTLIVNPGTTCEDSIWRYVKIFPYFSTNFTDSGKACPGSPIYFTDMTNSTIQPITNWEWNFGDGSTATVQDPEHSYASGGVYNVELVSQNIKGCIDTVVKQVPIDNFVPFAGDDTTIVKGQTIFFNATGGDSYVWSPGYELNDSLIGDPYGYYPDTGTFVYTVKVGSSFGCSGLDSIIVRVVNQSALFVPSAFTPDKGGINGLFRPIAIGYTSLNYLRVFDRWGEEVYYGNSFKEGEGWNGTYKNRPAQLGVYFWELSYTDRNGLSGTMKGDVTLIR